MIDFSDDFIDYLEEQPNIVFILDDDGYSCSIVNYIGNLEFEYELDEIEFEQIYNDFLAKNRVKKLNRLRNIILNNQYVSIHNLGK